MERADSVVYVLVLFALVAVVLALGAWVILGGIELLVVAGCSAGMTALIVLGRHMGFMK